MTKTERKAADLLAQAESDAAAEAVASEAAPAAGGAPVGPTAAIEPGPDEPDAGLTSNDYSVAFSPRQVAVGFAIVAGLVAVVAARRRHRSTPGND